MQFGLQINLAVYQDSEQAIERFIPNGPPGTADGEMLIQNNILYAAAGSVNAAWNYQYNRNGLYYFQQDQWSFKSAK
jgi:hypothetical protein